MTIREFSDHEEMQIAFVLDQIHTKLALGRDLQDILDAVEKTFPCPPHELVVEARRRHLRKVGEIDRYQPLSTIRRKELTEGTWYSGPSDDGIYWPRVKKDLIETIGEAATEQVDISSTKVLQSMAAPGEDEFSTRGLVVGYVQSGKTTNFISLISKAADEGYRLFIILAGMTDNLRNQTQKRVDEKLINVDRKHWFSLTKADHDFSKASKEVVDGNVEAIFSNPSQRIVAVVKKNGSILRSLNEFLGSKAKNSEWRITRDCPILIIDDEADQASVNVSVKATQEASVINAQIKELLRNRKTAYVAYTATPFANVLIDPNDADDIYPRDFIHVLPKPAGYFGMETIFGRERLFGEEDLEFDGLDMIRSIPEGEVPDTRAPLGKKAFADWEAHVSETLETAILWFILATAARRVRGQGDKHSSMLVHTAIRQQAHMMLLAEVQKFVDGITENWESAEVHERFETLWNEESKRVPSESVDCEPVTFDQVWEQVPGVLDDLHCVADNGQSGERLDYEANGLQTVIAVGGNTLSRGLTLEGLVCSYFVRNAAAYDTLIQMGRWFGFRRGYEDLPRVWLTEDLEKWFRDLALIEADMRQDMARYANELLTPLDFQACIRTHPSLEVTAKAKQRNSRQVSVSFSGKRVQTILFHHKASDWLGANIDAAKWLVDELQQGKSHELKKTNGTRVFRDVLPSVIEAFLDQYTFAEESQLGANDAILLKEYVKKEHKSESIRSWSVSFFGMHSKKSGGKTIRLGADFDLPLISRSQMVTSSELANIKSLVGSMDRINDVALSPEVTKEIIRELKELEVGHDARIMKIHEDHVGRDVGHLAIYAIDKDSRTTQSSDHLNAKGKKIEERNQRKDLDAADHVIGVGIFFPESINADSGVEYISAQQFIDHETVEAIRASEEEAYQDQPDGSEV